MGTASVPWGVGPRDQEEFSPVLERAGEPMARRTFDVVDVTEILIHWYAGRSISEVSTSLGVDRKTVRKYLEPAVAAGMTLGGSAVGRADWSVLVMDWFPQLADTEVERSE